MNIKVRLAIHDRHAIRLAWIGILIYDLCLAPVSQARFCARVLHNLGLDFHIFPAKEEEMKRPHVMKRVCQRSASPDPEFHGISSWFLPPRCNADFLQIN